MGKPSKNNGTGAAAVIQTRLTRLSNQNRQKTVAARVDPAFRIQLKQIGIDQGRSIKDLLREALDDLFVKYRKPHGAAGIHTRKDDARKQQVSLSLTISKPLDDKLEKLADENDIAKSEVLRKALVLFEVAIEAREQGNKLGVLSKDRQVLAEIVGL